MNKNKRKKKEMSEEDTSRQPILEHSEIDLMYCSNCNKHVSVKVKHKPGCYAYIFCLLFTFTGLLCIFWIPFCFKCFKDRLYICKHCDRTICIKTRM